MGLKWKDSNVAPIKHAAYVHPSFLIPPPRSNSINAWEEVLDLHYITGGDEEAQIKSTGQNVRRHLLITFR